MKRIVSIAFLLCLSAPAFGASTVTVKLITADIAHRIAGAAQKYCDEKGYPVTAVVAARDGRIQALLRHALAAPVTLKIARKKAVTSANLRVPSSELPKSLGRASKRMTRLRGGLPIEAGGQFFGGVGVAGATAEMDEECARAGIDAVQDDLDFGE